MSDENEIERDELECGVLFVGAGPANLAGAVRLMELIGEHNEAVEKGTVEGEAIDVEEAPIMVIEKAPDVGDHTMSGAILDPKALNELIPDFAEHDPPPPFEGPAQHDHLWFLRPGGGKISAPILPPTFDNHGNQIISLNKFVKWLAAIAEEKGVEIMPDFPGAEVLFDEGVISFYNGHGPFHLRFLPPLGVMKIEQWPEVFEIVERAMAKVAAG